MYVYNMGPKARGSVLQLFDLSVLYVFHTSGKSGQTAAEHFPELLDPYYLHTLRVIFKILLTLLNFFIF